MSKEKNYLFLRVYMIYIGFVILMGVVLYQTISIQLDGKNNLFSESDSKIPDSTIMKPARKGDILDRNMNTLLTHVPYYDIYMDPTVIKEEILDKDLNNLAQGLQDVLKEKNKTAQYFIDKILSAREQGKMSILIKRKVTNEQRNKLKSLPIFNLGRFKGGLIDNQEVIKIKKPLRGVLSRTLGDNRGIGIYGAFQKEIEGEEGKELVRKYANGWKRTGEIVKNPKKGLDIISSIDKDIQEVAHAELKKQILYLEADYGSVVLMEVKTGYIRAIANLKRKPNGTCLDEYNYAVGYGGEPGSTMKLASLMAGLEDGKFKITDSVNAKGSYFFSDGKKLDDSNWGRGYGKITIQRAFEVSSNVIAELINDNYKKEPQKFLNQLESFGLTEPLGIKLKGESTPDFIRPGEKRWNGISLPWMSIGYSMRQAPIQTLAFYNAVANNGQLLRPLFVEGLKGEDGYYEKISPVVLKDKICSNSTLKMMKKCLEGVMLRGTGKNIDNSLFNIAGKTGTVQLLNSSGSYKDSDNKSNYQASFVGYFPADNPIYTCIVVIAKPNPKKAFSGSTAAGTVFSEVANKIYATSFEYHTAINEGSIKQGLPDIKSGSAHDVKSICDKLSIPYKGSTSVDWVEIQKENDNQLNFKTIKIKDGEVPNVFGMNLRDAIYTLEKRGLVVELVGSGRVFKQSINPGESIVPGKIIRIELQ